LQKYRATCTPSCIHARNSGNRTSLYYIDATLPCGNIGLFCGNKGHFSGNIGLFCRNTELFAHPFTYTPEIARVLSLVVPLTLRCLLQWNKNSNLIGLLCGNIRHLTYRTLLRIYRTLLRICRARVRKYRVAKTHGSLVFIGYFPQK